MFIAPRRRFAKFLAAFASLAALPAPALLAQGQDYVKANFTKYEYKIPMRDGAKLFTAVYVPKDTSKTYPILMSRTPYSCRPYGADRYRDSVGPSEILAREGFIFAYQDVRGRWNSEGEFVNMRPHVPNKKSPADIDESSDTYDTVEWLIYNVRGHNGRVGIYGISYPGFYTAAGIIDAHPAIKAASPQAPVTDWFVGDDWHHNGALQLTHIFNFLATFGRPRPEPTTDFDPRFKHGTPDGYQFFYDLGPLPNVNGKHFKDEVAFWNEVAAHPNYDEFWKARNIRQHLKNIKPAVMTVGGWFDAENLFGALECYRHIEKNSHDCRNVLVMGPWLHGGWSRSDGNALGHVRFNDNTSAYYRDKIEAPFFRYYLKDKKDGDADSPPPPLPEASVFETGTNVWRQHDAWPPKTAQAKTLYFGEGGKLGWAAPKETSVGQGYDEYVSDPAKPVPFTERTTTAMAVEYMVDDQRFAARRPDVLVYQTDVLTEDVTIAGPLQAKLNVSTSGTDSDFIVKLIDVYPPEFPNPDPNPAGVQMGGFQQLVRGDVIRGKFRNSLEKPEPFEPGKPTAVSFKLQDTCHTFRTGHRIMIQVQSTWFPLIDRNPQTFVDIYQAKETDFQKATQRVFRTAEMASGVEVLVVQ
ncbi:MAG: CocE/NonD family hydrolase [Planctomycetia bacterium]|nr:CocE/NonD family hydrolase [Planctomycetia bacterium]